MFDRIREQLAALPGVVSAAGMNVLPLTPVMSVFTAEVEDRPIPASEAQLAMWGVAVTPQFTDALGIRLLRGRGFTAADGDGAEPVVIVSRATASRYWPGVDPLGRRLRPLGRAQWRIVVGVVDDVKYYGVGGPPYWLSGEVYFPLRQAMFPPQSISLTARIAGDAGGFEKRLPEAVQRACAECTVSAIAPLRATLERAVQAPRSMAWLVGSFALLALGLAAAGAYGVVSYGVVRRTRELGIRLALGASRARVAWLVIGSSLGCAIAGCGAGLAASWALTRWVRSLLFGIAEHDPASFAIPPVALAAVALLASLIPVLRAIRIDPAASLREE